MNIQMPLSAQGKHDKSLNKNWSEFIVFSLLINIIMMTTMRMMKYEWIVTKPNRRQYKTDRLAAATTAL